MKKLLPLALALLPFTTHAVDRLPLVLNSGYQQQLQSTDTLTAWNMQDTGLSASLYICTDGAMNFVSCSGGGLPSLASGTLLGNASASSAVAVQTTLTSLIDRVQGSSQGSLLYRNGTVWTVLTPGTIGNCLQTNGGSANPTWGSCGGSLPTIASGHLIANGTGSTALASDTAPSTWTDTAFGNAQGDLLYRNATTWGVLAPGTNGQCLQTRGASANPHWSACSGSTTNQNTRSLTFIISGGGTVIPTGIAGKLIIPFACTITSWTLLADQTGTLVVDLWKAPYVHNTPPTITNTITGTDLPTLSSELDHQDTVLSGWGSTAVAANDEILINVNSATTVTQATLALSCVASS